MNRYVVIGISVLALILLHKVRQTIFLRFDVSIRKVNILSLILVIGLVSFNGYYFIKQTMFLQELSKVGSFNSNKKSQYSQIWLDYMSYRDMQIGRLGSLDAFKQFIQSKDLDEKSYATTCIKEMLDEQGVKDSEEVAEECVKENFKDGGL